MPNNNEYLLAKYQADPDQIDQLFDADELEDRCFNTLREMYQEPINESKVNHPYNPVTNQYFDDPKQIKQLVSYNYNKDPRWMTKDEALSAGYKVDENARSKWLTVKDPNGQKRKVQYYNGKDIQGLVDYDKLRPKTDLDFSPAVKNLIEQN